MSESSVDDINHHRSLIRIGDARSGNAESSVAQVGNDGSAEPRILVGQLLRHGVNQLVADFITKGIVYFIEVVDKDERENSCAFIGDILFQPVEETSLMAQEQPSFEHQHYQKFV